MVVYYCYTYSTIHVGAKVARGAHAARNGFGDRGDVGRLLSVSVSAGLVTGDGMNRTDGRRRFDGVLRRLLPRRERNEPLLLGEPSRRSGEPPGEHSGERWL